MKKTIDIVHTTDELAVLFWEMNIERQVDFLVAIATRNVQHRHDHHRILAVELAAASGVAEAMVRTWAGQPNGDPPVKP